MAILKTTARVEESPATRRTPGRARLCCVLAACFLVAIFSSVHAQPAAREYDIKATLLFNFSQFVQWPTNGLPATNAPFVIGILGDDPFGKSLNQVVANERALGRPIEIRQFRRVEEAAGAQILYISKSEQARLDTILGELKRKPVLTVGEGGGDRFAHKGGMVAFVTKTNTIRLRINLDAARSAGLAISAKVLQLAEIVSTEKE